MEFYTLLELSFRKKSLSAFGTIGKNDSGDKLCLCRELEGGFHKIILCSFGLIIVRVLAEWFFRAGICEASVFKALLTCLNQQLPVYGSTSFNTF